MTIYVFVIDNSASMAQVSHTGSSLLDIGKSFIETFIKQRSKECQKDRFMVVSCDEYPSCIKAGWREGNTVLNEQLKRLRPTGTTTLESAVGRAFWLLSVNRIPQDAPGNGMRLVTAEPAVVIVISDGTLIDATPVFVPEKFESVGVEFFAEVYRPEHRCYGILLRFPNRTASPWLGALEAYPGGLGNFCAATGGRCYVATNPRILNNAVDTILGKTNIIYTRLTFEYIGPDLTEAPKPNGNSENSNPNGELPKTPDDLPWKTTITGVTKFPRNENAVLEGRKYFWPLPENYAPDPMFKKLPLRPGIPKLTFTYTPRAPPRWAEQQGIDRYEVELTPLTAFILERRNLGGHYPVIVPGSMHGSAHPSGYLVAEQTTVGHLAGSDFQKLSMPRWTVFFYVTPYNYPELIDLMDSKMHGTPLMTLKQRVQRYLNGVPIYYIYTHEKGMVLRMILKQYLGYDDDQRRNTPYNARVIQSIESFRQRMKMEYDECISEVGHALAQSNAEFNGIALGEIKIDALLSQLSVNKQFNVRDYVGDNKLQVFPIERDYRPKPPPSTLFTKISEIPREDLFENLAKIRVNYGLYARDHDLHVLEGGMPGDKIKLHEAEDLHNRPVKQMGDYEVYTRRLKEIGGAPLREVEPPEVRSQAFGNPFRLDKKVVAVDEVGESVENPDSPAPSGRSLSTSSRGRRRIQALDAGAFTRFRQRRLTLSETSSLPSWSPCPSPMYDPEPEPSDSNGYASDSTGDSGISAPSSPTPSLLNGFSGLSLKRSVSFSDSDDGSSVDAAVPPVKKRRISQGTAGGLNYIALRDRKRDVVKIVKKLNPVKPFVVLAEVEKLATDCSIVDKFALFKQGIHAAKSINRTGVASVLETALRKISAQM
uniref:VWFA domain-containing protein n=1 Tax=Panagrellus redivivus TaxID=6233 RepID=A0A7E4VXE8_PANRE